MKKNKEPESPHIEQTSTEKSSKGKPIPATSNQGESPVNPDPTLSTGQNDDIAHGEELPRWRLYLLVFALGVTNLLVALDTSILGTRSSCFLSPVSTVLTPARACYSYHNIRISYPRSHWLVQQCLSTDVHSLPACAWPPCSIL
jgi:hypothetical protein